MKSSLKLLVMTDRLNGVIQRPPSTDPVSVEARFPS
jgi:hypothetical protein